MWVCIMGTDGSGKEVIADILLKRNFKKISQTMKGEGEFAFLTKRLSEQLSAQAVMHKQDVFTVRSIYDTYEVMFPASEEMHRLSPFEQISANILMDNVGHNEELAPPHCIIYTKMDRRNIQDRMLLKGRQPNDDEIILQIKLYEELLAKIKVPILEIDMSQSPDVIRNEVNFSIDSMKSTSLAGQGIWKRHLFF